jgi:hypothetical protein
MSDALTRPPGDPEALYAAAAKFGQLAADASRTKGNILQGVETVLETWESPRATMFAQAAGDMSKRLDATAEQFGIANRVISQYAAALAAAQAAIDQYGRQHAAVQQQLRTTGQSGGDSPQQDMKLQHLSQRQGQLEQQADAVQADLRTAATRAAAALASATEVRVQGAAGMSPDAILRYVTSAWNAVHQVYRTFKDWSDPNLALLSLGQGLGQTGAALDALNKWRSAYDAELLLRQTRNLEEAKAIAVATVHGADDYRALRAWMEAQEVVSRFADDAQRATQAASEARVAFLDTVRLTSKFAKVCAVIGVVGGAYDLINPQHDGWRGAGDRVMGGVAVLAGGAQLAVMAGLLTLGPVGAGVVAGALIVTAAWTLGNVVWDHREQIGHALETAGKWVGDQAGKAVEGVKKVGSKIASGLKGLFG